MLIMTIKSSEINSSVIGSPDLWAFENFCGISYMWELYLVLAERKGMGKIGRKVVDGRGCFLKTEGTSFHGAHYFFTYQKNNKWIKIF